MLLATLNTPDKFQHTAARRRLQALLLYPKILTMFQHTAARRRLHLYFIQSRKFVKFQHTAARRRLRHAVGDA